MASSALTTSNAVYGAGVVNEILGSAAILSWADSLDAGLDDVIDLGARFWTLSEAAALAELKAALPRISKFCSSHAPHGRMVRTEPHLCNGCGHGHGHGHGSDCNRVTERALLRLLAAAGPGLWMISAANEALLIAKRLGLVSGCIAKSGCAAEDADIDGSDSHGSDGGAAGDCECGVRRWRALLCEDGDKYAGVWDGANASVALELDMACGAEAPEADFVVVLESLSGLKLNGEGRAQSATNTDSDTDTDTDPASGDCAGAGRFLRALPTSLLLGCALNAAGANAYACTKYDEARRLHKGALAVAARIAATAATAAPITAAVAGLPGSRCATGTATATATPAGAAGAAGAITADVHLLRSHALDGLGRVMRESGAYRHSLRLHRAAALAAIASATAGAGGKPPRLWPSVPVSYANAVSNAGVAALRGGDEALARRLHMAALRVREQTGDLRGVASSQGNLALLETNVDVALALYARSLATRRRLSDDWGIAGSLRAIATRLIARGGAEDLALARAHLRDAVPLFVEAGDALGIAECLESLGAVLQSSASSASGQQVDRLAARLLGAAVGVRVANGTAVELSSLDTARVERLRQQYAVAWAEGEQLDVTHAAQLAVTTASLTA
eukprot:g1735.t1